LDAPQKCGKITGTVKSNRIIRRSWTMAFLVVALAAPAAATAGQDPASVRVSSIEFAGNSEFDAGTLRLVMQTRKAGFWPWSNWLPFDQRRLDADLARLQAFYTDQGFPDARVRLGAATLDTEGDSIAIRIEIDEGAPLLVGAVTVEGLEGLPDAVTGPAATLPIRSGLRRTNGAFLATRDRISGLLREHGYPYARVEIEEQPPVDGQVALLVRVMPAPDARTGRSPRTM
jgi:outer membrane protein assembly factor BamA